jgi:predicted transcriptional regulator
MSETSRVQRWREGKRQHGLKAVTIWLTTEEELRLKALALQWHCSPSAVMQRALAQVVTSPSSQNSSPPDTFQLRELIREELAAREAAQASVTETVTGVVTATLARDLPALVRQLVEGLALEALGLPVTNTNGNATETECSGEVLPRQSSRRTRGEIGQRIAALLGEHPEGLSAEEIRVYLKPAKPLGDTLQGMRRQGKVHTRGQGKAMRYFVA